MKTRTVGSLGAALAFALIGASPALAHPAGHPQQAFGAQDPTGGHYHVGELGEKLMVVERALKCDCGCGLDVHSCQFQMQCVTSPVWSRRIREALERGEEVEAIQAGFVAQFGPTVLMAPPPEGFNLVGYLLPGFAIVLAGMFVGLIVRGVRGRPELASAGQPTDEQAERLAAALKKLDETEGPDW